MMDDSKYPSAITVPEIGRWTEVQPGILWLRMPLPFKLDHVNLYLIEDYDGWIMVDTGINNRSTHDVWLRIVAEGLAGKPLKKILATHYHPDHVGTAGWLAERWPLQLLMTTPEYNSACEIQASYNQVPTRQQLDHYQSTGHDVATSQEMAQSQQVLARLYAPIPDNYTVISDDDLLQIGNDNWRVIVSKGHSPAHACFYNEDRQLLISGDQVLPYISSNVSMLINQPDGNPLKHWLDGLARLGLSPDDTLVLPAHNHPFYGLQSRVQELIDGHMEMLEQIGPLLHSPQTVKQVAQKLFPHATQGFDLAVATGEAFAHLQYLVVEQSVIKTLNQSGQLVFDRVV